jgi:hypothetical protein
MDADLACHSARPRRQSSELANSCAPNPWTATTLLVEGMEEEGCQLVSANFPPFYSRIQSGAGFVEPGKS